MKEYKSNRYKYIKMNAKVGSSKSNTIKRETSKGTIKRARTQACGGCSRNTRNTVKKVKRI